MMVKKILSSLARALALALTLGLPAVAAEDHEDGGMDQQSRLTARPQPGAKTGAPQRGLRPLEVDGRQAGMIYVPQSYLPSRPAPLLVMLHGAGARGANVLDPLLQLAEAAGLIVVAPDSRGRTWDLIIDDYGPDVVLIDRALAQVFARYAVEPARVALGGFSDGASYALSLGLTNGDRFHSLIAFSPGFMRPARRRDAPRFFISHGIQDRALPIDRTSRRIVPELEREGYEVRYREFVGGHAIPAEIARAAIEWFLG
jgi:phospholipase/carboxylesterase